MAVENGAEEGGIEPLVTASRRGRCVVQVECARAPLLGAVVLRLNSDTMQDLVRWGVVAQLRQDDRPPPRRLTAPARTPVAILGWTVGGGCPAWTRRMAVQDVQREHEDVGRATC